jgi:hypothetical protein
MSIHSSRHSLFFSGSWAHCMSQYSLFVTNDPNGQLPTEQSVLFNDCLLHLP